MDREELKKFLRDNLRVNVSTVTHGNYYTNRSVTVKLLLDGEVISEDSDNLPSDPSETRPY